MYYTYILASRKNGRLYTGITNNIIRRVYEHKINMNCGYTSKYNIHMLVYYEEHQYVLNAIKREKNIKKWKRVWKIELIEKYNPGWKDLYNCHSCFRRNDN